MTRSATATGRVIGIMLLAQLVLAPVTNFALLSSAFAPPGFLANAAQHALEVRLSALLAFVNGALTLGMAIAALPVFRRHSEDMAHWLLALGTAGVATLAVESGALLSMLSLSQQYAAAGVDETFKPLARVVASARNWAHYTNLILAGGGIFVLYAFLWRFPLVPRALAAFGTLAALLQLSAITMAILGHRVVFLMLMPLGLSHLALALWLVTKGFEERRALP